MILCIVVPLCVNPFGAAGNSCQQSGRQTAAGDSCRLLDRLPPATVVDWRGLNTANSLHSSILKSLLVNHVIMCQLILKAWFQCIFVILGVKFGQFSHFFDTSGFDDEQRLDQRGKGLSR